MQQNPIQQRLQYLKKYLQDLQISEKEQKDNDKSLDDFVNQNQEFLEEFYRLRCISNKNDGYHTNNAYSMFYQFNNNIEKIQQEIDYLEFYNTNEDLINKFDEFCKKAKTTLEKELIRNFK